MLEQRRDIALDQFQLIQPQIGISDGEDIAGLGLFVNENALAIANNLFFHFQNPFALEHHGQDVSRRGMLRIVLLDELSQKGFGGVFLDGLGDGGRRFVNALPMGDKPAERLGIEKFRGPAGGTDVGAPELRFFFNEQCVIRFFVGKRPSAHFTAMPARLYVPLSNQAGET